MRCGGFVLLVLAILLPGCGVGSNAPTAGGAPVASKADHSYGCGVSNPALPKSVYVQTAKYGVSGFQFVQRPVEMSSAVHFTFKNLRWRCWGGTEAGATGLLMTDPSAKDPSPNGKFIQVPVDVRVYAPRACRGRLEYSKLDARFATAPPVGYPKLLRGNQPTKYTGIC